MNREQYKTSNNLQYFRTGITCDECLPFPGCVNGNCTQANECNCNGDWNGAFCDIRKLYDIVGIFWYAK